MKKIFSITDTKLIHEVLENAEYGTLALCQENKPYALPINFVSYNDMIYFHGAQQGKKMDFIKHNASASFSVVDAYSLLPSYFSTDKGNACPATQLFKSLIIDGKIEQVNEYAEKVEALEALMQKLQPEGNYKPLCDTAMYEKIICATAVFKLIPETFTCKFKFGQNFPLERRERVTKYLEERGTPTDLKTLELMQVLHVKD